MICRGLSALLAAMALIVGLGAAPGGAQGASDPLVLEPGSFVDDDTSVHQPNIEALAAAGITRGCNPPDNDHYCPTNPTTRAEMATFLTRALDLHATTTDHFTDDDGSIHEANINALAAAGITRGCNPPDNDHYCPTSETTREQMASFLTRALDLPAPVMWPMVHDASGDPIPGSSYAWHLGYGDLGYVAAGLVLAVNDDAAVWTSPDGVNWTFIPNTDHLFGGGAPGNQVSIGDVAVGNGAMVAVGSWFDPDYQFDSDAAVWISVDRLTWARVPHNETVFGDPGNNVQSMAAVVYRPGTGFVAVGGEGFSSDDDPGSVSEKIAAAWTSPDGSNWHRVDTSVALEGSRAQSMQHVAADHDVIVAVGTDDYGSKPAFWWSVDGETWNVTPEPPDLPAADSLSIAAVTPGSSGFIAIGAETVGEEHTPVVYSSADGRSWVRNILAIDGTLTGVTHDGDMYVAVGSDPEDTPAIWESSDGLSWRRIGERDGGPTNRRTRTVLDTPAGLLIGGTQTPDYGAHGAIWLRP